MIGIIKLAVLVIIMVGGSIISDKLEIGYRVSNSMSEKSFKMLRWIGFIILFCFSIWLDQEEFDYAYLIILNLAILWLIVLSKPKNRE